MPADILQAIVNHPDYQQTTPEVRQKVLQQAFNDPDVKALNTDQKLALVKQITYPGGYPTEQEGEPQFEGNIGAGEIIPQMKLQIGGGIDTLQKASQMPQGMDRVKQDISGGAQILSGVGTASDAAGMAVGVRAKALSDTLGLPPMAGNIIGSLAYATTPFALMGIGQKIAGAITSKFGSKVSQADLEAARSGLMTVQKTAAQTQEALDLAKAGEAASTVQASVQSGLSQASAASQSAAEKALVAGQTERTVGQTVTDALVKTRQTLPPAVPRSQIGTQIKSDIEAKINDLLVEARGQYDPIMQEAAKIPVGGVSRKQIGTIQPGVSEQVNAAQMAREAATWRDVSAETVQQVSDLSKTEGISVSEAFKQVLANQSKTTVADLILQKQRANVLVRRALNTGQDNAARIAKIELNNVNQQIQAASPDIAAKLKMADKFYAEQYAPVASYGAFPRTVRDMPVEDMANEIVRLGSRKGSLEALDSMEPVFASAEGQVTRAQLAGNVFQKLVERSGKGQVFYPVKAVAVFKQMDPELRTRLFGSSAAEITQGLETMAIATGNATQAKNMASALTDATKLAQSRFESMVAQSKMAKQIAQSVQAQAKAQIGPAQTNYNNTLAQAGVGQKLLETRAMRSASYGGGPGGSFMKIIGAEEMVRGGLNLIGGNLGIGSSQLLRGATLAVPIQLARMFASPMGKSVASTLATVASPGTQAYANATSDLANWMLQDQIAHAGAGQVVQQSKKDYEKEFQAAMKDSSIPIDEKIRRAMEKDQNYQAPHRGNPYVQSGSSR